MNRRFVASCVVALAAAPILHAQQCSGGADGGMDATGNQCNVPPQHAASVETRTRDLAPPVLRAALLAGAASASPRGGDRRSGAGAGARAAAPASVPAAKASRRER